MAPVFSATSSITIEKEQRTLSSLLTSLLTAPQICWWANSVAALLFLLLLLSSALPLLHPIPTFCLWRCRASANDSFPRLLRVSILSTICAAGSGALLLSVAVVAPRPLCYGDRPRPLRVGHCRGIRHPHLPWTSNNIAVGSTDGRPRMFRRALLTRFYPLLSMMDDPDFRQFRSPPLLPGCFACFLPAAPCDAPFAALREQL